MAVYFARCKMLAWGVMLSVCAAPVAEAISIDAANVNLSFVRTQDQSKTTGCGFELSVFDPASSVQLIHTFMINESAYQVTTSATYVNAKAHMNGDGNSEDKPLPVYNVWLLENTAVKAGVVDVNNPKSVLTYNVKSYFNGQAIGTTGAQYDRAFTDSSGAFVQQSVDLKVFYAELYLVLSGNFQLVFNTALQKPNTVFAINVPSNRPVYDQIRQCVSGTHWFKTAAAFGED